MPYTSDDVFAAFLNRHGPLRDSDRLDGLYAMYMVQRVATKIEKSVGVVAASFSLHVTDLYVLLLLHRARPDHTVPATEIQKVLAFTPGGITRRVDRMKDLGLVTRVPNPADGRAWLIRLTAKGIDLAERIRATDNTRVMQTFSELEDSDLATLITLLERIDAGLEPDADTDALDNSLQ